VAGRIRSIKKSSDFLGNRACDLQARSIVPQPITLLHGPYIITPISLSQGGLSMYMRD
jgi:hypothetical protein